MNIYAVWGENEKVYSQEVTDLVHDLYAYFYFLSPFFLRLLHN